MKYGGGQLIFCYQHSVHSGQPSLCSDWATEYTEEFVSMSGGGTKILFVPKMLYLFCGPYGFQFDGDTAAGIKRQ
jgi:hypothetical protein